MKKLKSTLPNMVIVLVAVALITGGLLAYVNNITAGPIKVQADKTLSDGIKAVMGGQEVKVTSNDTVRQAIDGKEAIFVIHKVSNMSGQWLGAAVESTTQGFGGDLKVLVGFDAKSAISGYTILQHAETPGLGAKANDWFQKGGKGDIIGKSPEKDNLTVKKDGGDIDAITASTITSRAFLKAITQAYSAYKGQEVDAHSGASQQQKKGE